MPEKSIVRLLVVNWALGITLGVLFAAGILAVDIGGLRSMIFRSDLAIPALALLFGGFAITCGGVVCASAVMRLPHEDRTSGTGLAEAAEPVPVPVRPLNRRSSY
ncbi:MAG: hypothetical protein LCH61_06595 [Proteobacteria bacterium]|nr:hypothetical protein [Pseudomonadota bacterium]